MCDEYLGILSPDDSLYSFLWHDVLERVLGVDQDRPVFDVFRLNRLTDNWSIFRYAERKSSIRLVCKFYGNKWLFDGEESGLVPRAELMRREFENLQRVRALGFDHPPRRVVRPLATNETINCVLVEEFAPGSDLNFYIRAAIHAGEGPQLRDRLTDVACFLADLHNSSRYDGAVGMAPVLAQLDEVIGQLANQRTIPSDQRQRLEQICDRWATSQDLVGGRPVLIHGDAKPDHFIFGGESDLTAIDLESMRAGDRAADLGSMAAGLKHLFFHQTGNAWVGEPFIQHLYSSYADLLPPSTDDFWGLTFRGRFYMGYTALRLSRNPLLDYIHRNSLIEYAERCLTV
jgi:Phosphotransferase enzyme family